jgi:hypothetical protein
MAAELGVDVNAANTDGRMAVDAAKTWGTSQSSSFWSRRVRV